MPPRLILTRSVPRSGKTPSHVLAQCGNRRMSFPPGTCHHEAAGALASALGLPPPAPLLSPPGPWHAAWRA
jgi:hypothetical protein